MVYGSGLSLSRLYDDSRSKEDSAFERVVRVLYMIKQEEERHHPPEYDLLAAGSKLRAVDLAFRHETPTMRVINDALQGLNTLRDLLYDARHRYQVSETNCHQARNVVTDLMNRADTVVEIKMQDPAKLNEMRDWCTANNRKCAVYPYKHQTLFIFDDKADAALFKLFWAD